jgi:hypothetical protein
VPRYRRKFHDPTTIITLNAPPGRLVPADDLRGWLEIAYQWITNPGSVFRDMTKFTFDPVDADIWAHAKCRSIRIERWKLDAINELCHNWGMNKGHLLRLGYILCRRTLK